MIQKLKDIIYLHDENDLSFDEIAEKKNVLKSKVYYWYNKLMTLAEENEDFREKIKKKIKEFLVKLKKHTEIELKHVDDEHFMIKCSEYLTQTFEKYSCGSRTIYQEIPCNYKNAEYIASIIVFTVLEVDYEIDLYKISYGKFLEILGTKASLIGFGIALNFFRRNVFVIDDKVYFKRVLEHSKNHLDKIKEYYDLNITNDKYINNVRDILEFLTKSKIIYRKSCRIGNSQKELELQKILETKGLAINEIFKISFYRRFSPDCLGFGIIYLLLVNEIKKLNQIKLCSLLNLSSYKAGVIIDIIKKTLQEYLVTKFYKFGYTNKTFELKLSRLWKQTKKLEVLFTIQLFNLLKLDYDDFTRILFSLEHSFALKRLRKHNFSYRRYTHIQKAIKKLRKTKIITKYQYKEANKIVRNALNIKIKTLEHHLIKYGFKYNKKNLETANNKNLRRKLRKLIESILNDDYPLEKFNNDRVIRGSEFYLQGTNEEQISVKIIKKRLIKPLISENKIILNKSDNTVIAIKEIARKTIKQFTNKFGFSPSHDPILTKTLMETKIITMEVPIWYENLIGHIDLLGIEKDKILIYEYKPEESQAYKGLPQVCVYAYMISKTLNIDINKIECTVYTPNVSITFKSTIINDIIKFVKIENSKRRKELTLKRNPKNIERELLKLIIN